MRDTIRLLDELFEARDLDAVAELMAPGVVYELARARFERLR